MVRETSSDHVSLTPSEGFVLTPQLEQVTDHALAYLQAGYPLHFSGPTGTGKTTLALHVASQLGRGVTLIHGDDEFGTSDLVGRSAGLRRSRLVDNYIHSVMKTAEEIESLWIDNRLTTACRNGDVLIYDEFNRSRPEANNALLSILSEGVLNLARQGRDHGGYLSVHPQFRAIFTSNPEEYAGVHKAQDALLDRLITIRLGHFDRDTEVAIAIARSGIQVEDAEVVVDVVRAVRDELGHGHRPTVRGCVAIARVLVQRQARAQAGDSFFRVVCRHILDTEAACTGDGQTAQRVDQIVEAVCARGKARRKRA